MRTAEVELALLLARRELWLLMSAAFVDPYHRQRFEILFGSGLRGGAVAAAALVVQELPTVNLGPAEVASAQLAPQELFAALDAEEETLEATYRQLFGLTAVSQRCPPCEIEYEPNTDVAYRSHRLADIAGFYRAFGLQVSTRAGERLDHITVEAEFLYLLLAKEAAALERGNQEGANVCRDARRKFFQEHMGWWLPAFARVLLRVAPPGYYRELAALTAAVSAAERVSLGLPVFPARVIPKGSGDGLQAGCFNCLGGQ